MKFPSIAVTALGVVVAAMQWFEIVYRLRLYYEDFGGERYVNHVGDGVFDLIHAINGALLVATVVATRSVWSNGRTWRWVLSAVLVANLAAWLSFSYMHRAGVLVEYHEFIRHMKQ